MYKLSWTIIALALAALALAIFASPLHAQATQGAGGTSYSCGADTDDLVAGSQICTCSGFADCTSMANSGICGGLGNRTTVDTKCNEETGDCWCSEGGVGTGRDTPIRDRRPNAVAAPTRNAPRDPKTRDHRPTSTAPRANQRDHRASVRNRAKPAQHPPGQIAQPPITPDSKPLTSGECTELGGVVKTLSLCKNNALGWPGSACITTDQHGSNHAVCLNMAGASSRRIEPASKPARRTGYEPTSATNNTTVAPLTSQECKGLGGSVLHTNQCSAKGQQACATVDKHGVVRVACINKVASD